MPSNSRALPGCPIRSSHGVAPCKVPWFAEEDESDASPSKGYHATKPLFSEPKMEVKGNKTKKKPHKCKICNLFIRTRIKGLY